MNQSFLGGRLYGESNLGPTYVKQHPYVDDDGIYVPLEEYALEGTVSHYKMVISKELFVEAYNKWIKGERGDA